MASRAARLATGALAGVLLAATLAVLPAGPALAGAPATTQRVAGANRYATAAAIARDAYPRGAGAAVLARGDLTVDALSGAGVAGSVHGPILLTEPDRLPPTTLATLDELGVTEVVVLGGPGAVSSAVVAELESAGRSVTRLAAADRYGTAAVAAQWVLDRGIGALYGAGTAVLVRGDLSADATTVGPMAALRHFPVLLTRPGSLPASTREVLARPEVGYVLAVGGAKAVAPSVLAEVDALPGTVTGRVAGRNRFDTAAAVADLGLRKGGLQAPQVLLARGDLPVDALAAAPLGAARRSPLLLVGPGGGGPLPDLAYDTVAWFSAHAGAVRTVTAVGGPAAVGAAALAEVATTARLPERTYTYQVRTRGSVTQDVEAFAQHVATTLLDGRGWSLDHRVVFRRVSSGGDFTVFLASPSAVAAAASLCSSQWSCTVGDAVLINADRWRLGTPSYRSRGLDDYRHYVVLHETGHWFGLGHRYCPSPGSPAPVMQQQSKGLQGCRSNVWPLASERAAVQAVALR